MRDTTEPQAHPPLFLVDFDQPQAIWSKLASWLLQGSLYAKHEFHWPCVATVDAHGQPDARIVVLRHFLSKERLLTFHTDIRSKKIAQIRKSPSVVFLFHDHHSRLQVRCFTEAVVHHQSDIATHEFDQLSAFTQASYTSPAPGEPEAHDAPFAYPPPPPFDRAVALANFAAVQCRIQEVDALELHTQGHRRARLTWPNEQLHLVRIGA
jgi:hypothetical protein